MRKTPALSRGRLIFPSPALTPVTRESAESAIERVSASRGDMLLELSVSAAVPSKKSAAGLSFLTFLRFSMSLKKFWKRLKSPSESRSKKEIILQRFSGTASLITSANATEQERKSVPIKLIISEERNGIFIPALPIPIAAANPSVHTAIIRSSIFIVRVTLWILGYGLHPLTEQFMLNYKKCD